MDLGRERCRAAFGLLVAGLGLFGGGCMAPRQAAVCDWEALGVEAPAGFREEDDDEDREASKASSTPQSYIDAARALRTHGQQEEALAVLEKAIELYPETPSLLVLRGELRCETGFRRAAERDFLRALDLAPQDAGVWRSLGEVRLALALPASANQALRHCNALQPNDPQTMALLARASWDCGQIEKAWGLYKAALEDPDTASLELLVEAGTLYSSAKIQARHPEDRALAFGWLYRALSRDPGLARAHFLRGVLFEGEDRKENALAAYRSALEADPTCAGAHTKLALLLTEQGELDEAKVFAGQALERERDKDLRRVLEEIARS